VLTACASPLTSEHWFLQFHVKANVRFTVISHRGGRASPVPRCVLVAVPSLSPRRGGSAASVRFRHPMLPSPYGSGLGPRISAFRGHLCVHCRYGPVTRNLPKGDLVDGLQDVGTLTTRHPAIRTTGLLTFALAGLSPAEHTSSYWSQLPYGGFSPVWLQGWHIRRDLPDASFSLSLLPAYTARRPVCLRPSCFSVDPPKVGSVHAIDCTAMRWNRSTRLIPDTLDRADT
jgi:hypothetical protein